MNNLLIIGAGGHGKVVADAAETAGHWDKIAFADDKYPELKSHCDWPVVSTIRDAACLLEEYRDVAVALGDNRKRVECLKYFMNIGFQAPCVIHQRAYISPRAAIAPGTVVLAQAAINACARIGFGCIINTGAIVEHDCLIEEGIHLSPGSRLAGNVKVGQLAWVGTGACVIPGKVIGDRTIVGAGAVVINDVPDGISVAGVPAKLIRKKENLYE